MDFINRDSRKINLSPFFHPFFHKNQFAISNPDYMEAFLNGDVAKVGGGEYQMQGDSMGMDDLLNYYLKTKYATDTAEGKNDLLE